MTTKKQPETQPRRAVIRIGYNSYVLPIDNATTVVSALANAELIETAGYGDTRLYYIGGGDSIDLQLELLPEHQYLQGKFAGPKDTYNNEEDINQ